MITTTTMIYMDLVGTCVYFEILNLIYCGAEVQENGVILSYVSDNFVLYNVEQI